MQHTACALTQSTCAHSHKGDFAYDPSLVHGANGSTAVHNAAVEAGRRVAAARPDLIVLTTPHGKRSASLPCRGRAMHHATTCPHALRRFHVVVMAICPLMVAVETLASLPLHHFHLTFPQALRHFHIIRHIMIIFI